MNRVGNRPGIASELKGIAKFQEGMREVEEGSEPVTESPEQTVQSVDGSYLFTQEAADYVASQGVTIENLSKEELEALLAEGELHSVPMNIRGLQDCVVCQGYVVGTKDETPLLYGKDGIDSIDIRGLATEGRFVSFGESPTILDRDELVELMGANIHGAGPIMGEREEEMAKKNALDASHRDMPHKSSHFYEHQAEEATRLPGEEGNIRPTI